MNKLTLFDFQGSQVRTIMVKGNPYIVGNDVAQTLGYTDYRHVVANHVDKEDKLRVQIDHAGQNRLMTVINESGVYDLIFDASRQGKNEDIRRRAKEFRHWVTNDVLPSIRQTGAYVAPQTAADWLNNPDMMIQALERYKAASEENHWLHDERKIMLPKARFADAVSDADNTILVRELAKLLRQNGVVIGEKRLYAWFRNNGYLIRKGSDYNRPTQKAMEMGLFSVKETVIQHSDGRTTVKGTTKVTGKGQTYFIDKFLSEAREA
ncbi:phage antirepressor [Levilactobacillus wangkuiensis]|uniref:phage antirepressor n=1 Tax=Levilactobacillus wangkuiensis TaxID=2799566 RepID=UPI0019509BFD|nr:phage antirepressor KilAC domain-containing protein [Levilactobacillus wangkuiensis]